MITGGLLWCSALLIAVLGLELISFVYSKIRCYKRRRITIPRINPSPFPQESCFLRKRDYVLPCIYAIVFIGINIVLMCLRGSIHRDYRAMTRNCALMQDYTSTTTSVEEAEIFARLLHTDTTEYIKYVLTLVNTVDTRQMCVGFAVDASAEERATTVTYMQNWIHMSERLYPLNSYPCHYATDFIKAVQDIMKGCMYDDAELLSSVHIPTFESNDPVFLYCLCEALSVVFFSFLFIGSINLFESICTCLHRKKVSVYWLL